MKTIKIDTLELARLMVDHADLTGSTDWSIYFDKDEHLDVYPIPILRRTNIYLPNAMIDCHRKILRIKLLMKWPNGSRRMGLNYTKNRPAVV